MGAVTVGCGRRLGALERGGVPLPLFQCIPPFHFAFTRLQLDPSKDSTAKHSLFGQIHSLLGAKPPAFFRTSKRLWSVVFAGEGADDVGGPYRESLAGLCAELMSGATPLFLPSPNQRHNVGAQRDKWTLNPAANKPLHFSMLTFLGRLMGGCVRGGEPLPLYITSDVWKSIVGDTVTVADLEHVDKTLMQSMNIFASLDKQVCRDPGTLTE